WERPASSFFFSSRRRHTRFSRDWSSDVCSSDLDFLNGTLPPQLRPSFWALLGADTSSIGQLDASRAADALLESQQQPVTASEPDAPGQSGPTPSATEPSGPR